MRPRPIRSQLYLPILRFGITDEDWGFVILAGVIGYAAPFALRLEFFHLPVELIGWLLTMGLSVLALNLIRSKSRPGWLRHTIQSRLRGAVSRRWLPEEIEGRQKSWMRTEL